MSLVSTRLAVLAIALLPVVGDAASLTLDQALMLAVQRSAAARAARAEATSARQAARAAGQLPDPAVSVGVDNLPVTGTDRFSTTADSQTMKRIGLSQQWVSRDKREARLSALLRLDPKEDDGAFNPCAAKVQSSRPGYSEQTAEQRSRDYGVDR